MQQILKSLNTLSMKTSTFGIALSSCSLPNCPPTFQLDDNTIELGLGVHGENGIGQIKVSTFVIVAKSGMHLLYGSRYYLH